MAVPIYYTTHVSNDYITIFNKLIIAETNIIKNYKLVVVNLNLVLCEDDSHEKPVIHTMFDFFLCITYVTNSYQTLCLKHNILYS